MAIIYRCDRCGKDFNNVIRLRDYPRHETFDGGDSYKYGKPAGVIDVVDSLCGNCASVVNYVIEHKNITLDSLLILADARPATQNELDALVGAMREEPITPDPDIPF